MMNLIQSRSILALLVFVYLGYANILNAQEGFKGERAPNPKVNRPASTPKPKPTKGPRPAAPAKIPIAEQIEEAIDRGNSARDADKLKEAEKQYRLAIGLNTNEWRAWYGLGNVLNEAGNYDPAVDALIEAIRLNPDSAEAQHSLGTSYFLKEQFAVAIEHYREAVRLKPDYVYAYYDLGMAYVKIKNRDAALEQYQILKRLNPGLADNLRSYIR